MKPLKISHAGVTRKALLGMADSIPGAWMGIRIAGLLLLLSGWKSTAVSQLFGLSRQAVVDWIRKANQLGFDSIHDDSAAFGGEGLLGFDFLRRFQMSLDTDKKVMVLTPRN